MLYISVHGADIRLDIFSPLVSILGCMIGYLIFLSVRNFLPKTIQDKGWFLVILIIVLSAFFNSIGLSRLHSSANDLEYLLAYFWGDVLGGIFFLVLAMFTWRFLKNSNFS